MARRRSPRWAVCVPISCCSTSACPGIDGVEVLRRIRRADPDVPVIMVTANEDVALAKEMLKLGAFDYVAKPFDFSYLDRGVSEAAETPEPADGHLAGAGASRVPRRPRHGRRGAQLDREPPGDRRAGGGAAGRQADNAKEAAQHLGELALLLGIAAELGDLTGPDLAAVESALSSARRALPSAG